eukprot:scaffold281161_cov19-Tisochrysis_lutea.AAC.3
MSGASNVAKGLTQPPSLLLQACTPEAYKPGKPRSPAVIAIGTDTLSKFSYGALLQRAKTSWPGWQCCSDMSCNAHRHPGLVCNVAKVADMLP